MKKIAYALDDGTGDVVFSVVSGVETPGLPGAAYLPYLDFTAFSVDDTNALNLEIRMKNQAGFTDRKLDTAVIGVDAYHSFSFLMPGTQASPVFGNVQVFSYFDEPGAAQAQGMVYTVEFCAIPSASVRYCGNPTALPFTFEEGAIVIELPKTYLTRSGPLGSLFPQLAPKIRAGDTLTQVTVLAYGHVMGYTSIGGETPNELRDYVPNDGAAPDFTFVHPSVTDDLEIKFTQVGVVAGEENIVGVEIKNLADRKRLLNLVVDVLEMDGEWTIKTAPNVTVRAFDVLNATLRITPPLAANGPPPSVTFQLRAEVVTEPGVLAAVQASLVSTKPLARGEHRWYVHAGDIRGSLARVPIELFSFRDGWLTRVEQDATTKDDGGVPLFYGGGTSGVDFIASLPTLDGIPNPAKLTGQPATAHLRIDSPFPMEAVITSHLSTADRILAIGTTQASLQRGVNDVDVTMPLDPAALRLAPEDGQLKWDVVVHREGLEGFGLAFASFVDSPNLMPKESWLDLPLDREVVIPPDPDLPDVSLSASDDLDAFINPGRRTAFEWDLRNDHTGVVELELVVENLTRPWDHSVAPASILRLKPGQSVSVAVLLDSPRDAKEGEICELRLVIREPDSGRVFAGGARRAIVTSGVEVENETFELDEDGIAAMKQPEGKSPGLGVVGVLGLLAAAATVRTRRR
jgi:hypothetical protein